MAVWVCVSLHVCSAVTKCSILATFSWILIRGFLFIITWCQSVRSLQGRRSFSEWWWSSWRWGSGRVQTLPSLQACSHGTGSCEVTLEGSSPSCKARRGWACILHIHMHMQGLPVSYNCTGSCTLTTASCSTAWECGLSNGHNAWTRRPSPLEHWNYNYSCVYRMNYLNYCRIKKKSY